MMAQEPNGKYMPKLDLTMKKGVVIDVDWEGGTPTDDCAKFAYGPAAASACQGRAPGRRANPWLPKKVEFEGETFELDDKLRAPKCTGGLDALVQVLLPASNGAPPTIMPAFIQFSRSSALAGKQLASMLKMSATEPAWSRLYELGAKSKTNDKGTYFVTTIMQKGYTNTALAAQASALFDASNELTYRADSDEEETAQSSSKGGSVPKRTLDEDAAPGSDDPSGPGDVF